MYERKGGGGLLAALLAFVLGGLVGAAAGILFAPHSGKETRDQLKHRADDLMDQGKDFYESQRQRVLEAVESGKEVASERSEEIQARIEDARSKLKEGVDNIADFAEEKVESLKKKTAETASEPTLEEPGSSSAGA